MLKRWAVIGLALLTLAVTFTTASSLAAPVRSPSLSVVTVNGVDPGACEAKWTARSLDPGMSYNVGIYEGSTLVHWLTVQTADTRGTIRAVTASGFGSELNNTHTLSATLVYNGVQVAAIDDVVVTRCKAQ